MNTKLLIEKNEKVLWESKPVTVKLFGANNLFLLFSGWYSILFLVFGMFQLSGYLDLKNVFTLRYGGISIFIIVILVMISVMPCYLVAVRYWVVPMLRKKSCYIVTNKRIIYVQSLLNKKNILSIYDIKNIFRINNQDGTVTLHFVESGDWNRLYRGTGLDYFSVWPGDSVVSFFNITWSNELKKTLNQLKLKITLVEK